MLQSEAEERRKTGGEKSKAYQAGLLVRRVVNVQNLYIHSGFLSLFLSGEINELFKLC